MKLIPMTDFAIEHGKNLDTFSKDVKAKFFESIMNYANLLKQPLELWMFVPCDEKGCVIEDCQEPNREDYWDRENDVFNSELYQFRLNNYKRYLKSKERVLFEGFKVNELKLKDESTHNVTNGIVSVYWKDSITKRFRLSRGLRTIEDLVVYRPDLTPTAIKHIGL